MLLSKMVDNPLIGCNDVLTTRGSCIAIGMLESGVVSAREASELINDKKIKRYLQKVVLEYVESKNLKV